MKRRRKGDNGEADKGALSVSKLDTVAAVMTTRTGRTSGKDTMSTVERALLSWTFERLVSLESSDVRIDPGNASCCTCCTACICASLSDSFSKVRVYRSSRAHPPDAAYRSALLYCTSRLACAVPRIYIVAFDRLRKPCILDELAEKRISARFLL